MFDIDVNGFLTNEYDFYVWENPREMASNNLSNQILPVWYQDAIIYWDVVCWFVERWVQIFSNDADLQIVENWLLEMTGFIMDVQTSLKDLLSRLVWSTTFFNHYVSISSVYLGYYSQPNKSVYIISNLWMTMPSKYQIIWKEFERCVESLEFSNGTFGRRITCFIIIYNEIIHLNLNLHFPLLPPIPHLPQQVQLYELALRQHHSLENEEQVNVGQQHMLIYHLFQRHQLAH